MISNTLAHLRKTSLALAIGCVVSNSWAQTPAQDSEDPRHGEGHEHDTLEQVIVTATPIERSAVELSQSAVVLSGHELAREVSNNLGDTLTRLPGLYNASFGQNVGRPMIRGQQGVRVGILSDGMTTFDASAASQDHAVATEPFIADRIEVLRGPSTLLYGSGAIGGVVNVVTDVIPKEVPEDGLTGRALIQGDTAANQRLGAARLDFGSGSFALHVNGFYRRSDDYEIPGAAELYPDDDHEEEHEEGHEEGHDDEHGEEEVTGILENSFLDNEGGSIGGAWFGDRWSAGLSWTGYRSNYGIPGAHAHHHEEEEHDEMDHGDDHDEGEEEEENVTIGMDSNRIDGLVAAIDPFRGFDSMELKLAFTDYSHTEFEGDEIGTMFDSESTDLRLELGHEQWGAWQGTFGAQWSGVDFSAVGEEAFVPPSQTDTGALFVVESADYGDWQLDFGLRYEDTKIDSFIIEHDDHDEEEHGDEEHDESEEALPASRSFNPFSVSLGAVWHLSETNHLAFSFARAERAPNSVELFSNGPHIATQTFEVGNPDLGIETNMHYEISYRMHGGPITGSVTLYHDDFDDHIYESDTGMEEDGLPVRLWSQQDVEFTGGELEVRWDLGRHSFGHWQVYGFYDRVKATLADGNPLPRIPPERIGLGLDWDLGAFAANAMWINADDQTRVADFETPTPGYDLVNAEISWYFQATETIDFDVFLKGQNLLNEDIRINTSFLKDQAPQIGRNFVLGVRSTF